MRQEIAGLAFVAACVGVPLGIWLAFDPPPPPPKFECREGQLVPTVPLESISVGAGQVCGLDLDGRPVCWDPEWHGCSR